MENEEQRDAAELPEGRIQPDDSFLEYLNTEYRKYRIATLVLAVIGFSLMLVTVALAQNGVVTLKVYNVLMSIANLFIVFMLVLAFTRTRPFRKRIRDYDKNYVGITDPNASDGVRMEERALPDMDDFYKIFERGVRTELIPETEEYAKLRRIWLATFAAAAALVLAAVAVYFVAPAASLVQTLLMICAFALVIVAFYIDRTRMKPIRNQWAREKYGMGEFQVRDNMRSAKAKR